MSAGFPVRGDNFIRVGVMLNRNALFPFVDLIVCSECCRMFTRGGQKSALIVCHSCRRRLAKEEAPQR